MEEAAKRARAAGATTLTSRPVCSGGGGDMISPNANLKVYLCRDPVDMSKQIDGLALLVQEAMALNLFDKALFVFGNCKRDKVKLLASFWPWIFGGGAIDYVETYKWLIVPLAVIYFVAATMRMRNRREIIAE